MSVSGPQHVPLRTARWWRWLLPLGVVAAAVLWLVGTATPPPRVGRQLFGMWSTRNLGVAVALAWVGGLLALHSASRRALFRGVFASVLVGVTLGALELVGRVGIANWATLFGLRHVAPLGSVRLPGVVVTGSGGEDTATLWRIPRDRIPFEYRTDRLGFRNQHDRAAAAIYCLGDSFLVAGLLPIEATVTARLERDLGVPAMSLALIGIGAQEARDLWRDAALPARGSTVLQFVTEDNDLVDSARFRQGRKSFDIASPTARSFLDSAIVWLQRTTQPTPGEARTHVGTIEGRAVAFQWDANAFEGLQGEVQEVLGAIAELHAEVEAAGGRHGVVLIPSKLRVLGPRCTWPEDSALRDVASHLGPLPDALARWCAEREIPRLDLTPALQAVAGPELPYFEYDTHWSTAGHAAVARALAAWPFVR